MPVSTVVHRQLQSLPIFRWFVSLNWCLVYPTPNCFKDHLQSWSFYRRYQMCMCRHIPGCISSMRWLVSISPFSRPSSITLFWEIRSFIRTGQQNVLNNTNLPTIVGDIRNICALESTLLGNVTNVNSNPSPNSGGSFTQDVGLSIGTMTSILGIFLANGWLGFWTMDLYWNLLWRTHDYSCSITIKPRPL